MLQETCWLRCLVVSVLPEWGVITRQSRRDHMIMKYMKNQQLMLV